MERGELLQRGLEGGSTGSFILEINRRHSVNRVKMGRALLERSDRLCEERGLIEGGKKGQ